MQQKAQREHRRGNRRAPRGDDDGKLAVLAQNLAEVAQKEHGKAAQQGLQDQRAGSRQAGVAHGETGGDQHHGGQQHGLRQFHLEPDLVAARRKARLFKAVDIGGQIPEADGAGGAETVADAVAGQIGGDGGAVGQQAGRLFGIARRQGPGLAARDPPEAGVQPRQIGHDARCRGAVLGKGQKGHRVKLGAVQIGALGMNDDLALVVALPQPQPAIGQRQHRCGAGMTRGQRVIAFRGDRDDRVQHRHGEGADQQRADHRRQQKPQARAPRRPHHHQFGRPRQPQKQPDCRQHQDQRQHLIDRRRHIGQRQHQALRQRDAGVGKTAQLVDQVDHQHQAEEAGKDPGEQPQEAPRDIQA